MTINLTDRLLETLHASRENAVITLHDGQTMKGRIVDYDGYTILLSGDPDLLVYRHSILKLLPASSPVRTSRPQETVRKTAAPQKHRQQKERKPPRREPQPSPRQVSTEPGFGNPMADKMLDWLKKQKGDA